MKIPHYLQIALGVLLKDPRDGQIIQFPMVVEELHDDGLLKQVERLMKVFEKRGFLPPSEVELEKARREQEEVSEAQIAAEVAKQHAEGKGYDPNLLDAMLRHHKGEPQ